MRQVIEYPVYNGPQRPPMGRNLAGSLFFKCFTIRLEQAETRFSPYRFVDFIADFTRQRGGICNKCISQHACFEYQVGASLVDRSAVDRKFLGQHNTINESDYYYCPLVGATLDSSRLEARESRFAETGAPIHIVIANWDDEYALKFLSIAAPDNPRICAIYEALFSPTFISTPTEREVGSSRVDLQACKLEYSIVSPK